VRCWLKINEKRLGTRLDPVRGQRVDQDAACLEKPSILVRDADRLIGKDGLRGEMAVERAFADIAPPGGPAIAKTQLPPPLRISDIIKAHRATLHREQGRATGKAHRLAAHPPIAPVSDQKPSAARLGRSLWRVFRLSLETWFAKEAAGLQAKFR
jgi:hypothetical protein